MNALVERYLAALSHTPLTEHIGFVSRKHGLLIESRGPAQAGIGDMCQIEINPNTLPVTAEVVGFNAAHLLLLPYGAVTGLQPNSRVVTCGKPLSIPVGDALLGRVIDAFGRPLDHAGPLLTQTYRPVRQAPVAAMQRQRIRTLLETGVRAIDTLLTLGVGQRVAIMAGSGVGKSTLLAMLAEHCVAQVAVVGLIGERGREVHDFIDTLRGAEGFCQTVIVVATADEPAPVREAAALSTMAVAEYFRDQGQSVLLIMDSLTRYAMARREVGLAIGEPATSRGYTPSVFSELAHLLERCGTGRDGGTISGLFTVLVEGDDLHDPIADSVRGIVDGHIVLTRELANRGHFPAIDVPASLSRLAMALVTPTEQALMRRCRQALSTLAASKDLLELGVYRPGNDPELDKLLQIQAPLTQFLQQARDEQSTRASAIAALAKLFQALDHAA